MELQSGNFAYLDDEIAMRLSICTCVVAYKPGDILVLHLPPAAPLFCPGKGMLRILDDFTIEEIMSNHSPLDSLVYMASGRRLSDIDLQLDNYFSMNGYRIYGSELNNPCIAKVDSRSISLTSEGSCTCMEFGRQYRKNIRL